MYYEKGTIYFNDYFTNFEPPIPKKGTMTVKKYVDSFNAVCIIRYNAYNELYQYYVIAANPSKPFSILNPVESLMYNVNDWVNQGNLGDLERNNTILYSWYDEEEGILFPTPQEPTTLMWYDDVFHKPIDDRLVGITDIYKADIPIFTITKEDYTALNNYITHGDASGADNYDDLPQENKRLDTLYFKTALEKGAKGNKGDYGICDKVPEGSLILYDGDEIPEGYEEVESPI